MSNDSSALEYEVSYRDIKYPRLELKTGKLLLILPIHREPDGVLSKYEAWVREKTKFISECLEDSADRELIERTGDELKHLAYSFAAEAVCELNVSINTIYFRFMKTKWASCSPKGNLTLNRLMSWLPENLIDYVIFHEVAHIIEKKHSDRFWNIIARRFDNYERLERDLCTYWFLIHAARHDPLSTTL